MPWRWPGQPHSPTNQIDLFEQLHDPNIYQTFCIAVKPLTVLTEPSRATMIGRNGRHANWHAFAGLITSYADSHVAKARAVRASDSDFVPKSGHRWRQSDLCRRQLGVGEIDNRLMFYGGKDNYLVTPIP